jgi:hypothetical protein
VLATSRAARHSSDSGFSDRHLVLRNEQVEVVLLDSACYGGAGCRRLRARDILVGLSNGHSLPNFEQRCVIG